MSLDGEVADVLVCNFWTMSEDTNHFRPWQHFHRLVAHEAMDTIAHTERLRLSVFFLLCPGRSTVGDSSRVHFKFVQPSDEVLGFQMKNLMNKLRKKEVRYEVWDEEGLLLALRWVFGYVRREQESKDRREQIKVTGPGGTQDAEGESMEVDEESLELDQIRWDKGPVSSLLVDVVEGVDEQPLPTKGVKQRRLWIVSSKALEILQNVKEDFLTQMMASTTISDG